MGGCSSVICRPHIRSINASASLERVVPRFGAAINTSQNHGFRIPIAQPTGAYVYLYALYVSKLLTPDRCSRRNVPCLHTERKETHNGRSRQLLSCLHNWL